MTGLLESKQIDKIMRGFVCTLTTSLNRPPMDLVRQIRWERVDSAPFTRYCHAPVLGFFVFVLNARKVSDKMPEWG